MISRLNNLNIKIGSASQATKGIMRKQTKIGAIARFATAVSLLFMANTVMAGPISPSLYGTLTNGTLPNGDQSYTFARFDTVNGPMPGHATPLFDFTLPFGISGMTFDPDTGKFVVISPGGMLAEIDGAGVGTPKPITGLASPFTNFQGIEYDPSQPDPADRLLVTYGDDPTNGNLQNKMASIAIGALSASIVHHSDPLAISDGDAIVFNPASSQLIVADTNNPPFESISGIFSATPVINNYASVYDSEMWEPACDSDGTMYFSNRTTHSLYRLAVNGLECDASQFPFSHDCYVLVGPHYDAEPSTFAVGLAFGTPEPSSLMLVALGIGGLLSRRRRVAL